MAAGFAAGQSIDILACLIAQSLSDQLGQRFIVESKPGADGNIAADGYTKLHRQRCGI